MATEERHKWAEALSEYVDPLDRRFPNNPYKATTRGWRDRVAVAEVAGRARMLESPLNTKLNQPQNPIEERWAEYFALVSAAEKRGDDLAEHAAWVELSRQYRVDEPKERPWYLYATARAEAQAARSRSAVPAPSGFWVKPAPPNCSGVSTRPGASGPRSWRRTANSRPSPTSFPPPRRPRPPSPLAREATGWRSGMFVEDGTNPPRGRPSDG